VLTGALFSTLFRAEAIKFGYHCCPFVFVLHSPSHFASQQTARRSSTQISGAFFGLNYDTPFRPAKDRTAAFAALLYFRLNLALFFG
jgi:hypothetical protein